MLRTTKGVIVLLSLCGLLFQLNSINTKLEDSPKNQPIENLFLNSANVASNMLSHVDVFDKITKQTKPDFRPKLICPIDLSGLQCGEALPVPYSRIEDFLENGGSYEEFCEGEFSLSSSDFGDPDQLNYCSEVFSLARRRYTLTDACGYSKSCIQRFVYELDTEAPVVDCSVIEDFYVDCEAYDREEQVQQWIQETKVALLAVSTDNCGIRNASDNYLENVQEEVGCDPSEALMVTYYIYDACGQRVSCNASIKPKPPKPNLSQPHDKAGFICGDALPAAATTIEEYIALGGSIEEHCGRGLSLSHTDIGDLESVDFCSDRPIIIRRRYTVTDGCGNSRSSIQRFEFSRDEEAPSIDCGSMNDFTIDCDKSLLEGDIQEWISSMQNKIMKSATDNCSALEISHNYTAGSAADMDCTTTDQMNVSFSVSDACGNTSRCTASIISNLPSVPRPEVICVTDIEGIRCGDNIPAGAATLAEFTAAGGEIIDYCDGQISISSELVGTRDDIDICTNISNVMRRRYIITDECGNERRCIQRLIFEQDIVAPEVDCDLTNDLIVNCSTTVNDEDVVSWLTLVEDDLAIASSDNCSDVTITNDYTENAVESIDCNDNSELIVTFLIADDCGNSSSCSGSIIKQEMDTDGLVLGNKIDRINAIKLHQNSPNPFEESTAISFELRERTKLRLTVYDMSGKLLFEQSKEHNEGVNTINITRDMLNNISGVVFYSLEANGFKEVKTMIILE